MVFDSNNFYKFILLKFKNNRARFRFKKNLESVIGDFRYEGHEFSYIAEMDIITAVDKRDRTYQF